MCPPQHQRTTACRYTRLSDAEVLKRLLEICDAERITKTDEGLEAIIFTAQGDMRQALNNIQSTFSGFGLVNSDNVFKVCDQPHPLLVQNIVRACLSAAIDPAYHGIPRTFFSFRGPSSSRARPKTAGMLDLWKLGYSPIDIVGTLMRVVKTFDMPEFTKLEFIREIGNTHLRYVGAGGMSFVAGMRGNTQAKPRFQGPGGHRLAGAADGAPGPSLPPEPRPPHQGVDCKKKRRGGRFLIDYSRASHYSMSPPKMRQHSSQTRTGFMRSNLGMAHCREEHFLHSTRPQCRLLFHSSSQ